MNKLRLTVSAFALLAFTLAISSAAQAQATRTWVSGVGDDVNPCSRTAPCKTYAGAISKTAKDGEISTLDPGGFGSVTITKSITINGGGQGQGYGSILAAGTNGVVINITDAADVRKAVRLNWLDINGASSGLDGVRFLAGTSLHIENSTIDGVTGDGLEVAAGAAGNFEVVIRNTVIRNCATAGVRMVSTGATVNVSVDNSQLSNNGNGVDVQAGTLTITRTNISGSTNSGITAGGSVGAVVNASDNQITMNGTGVTAANGFATIRLNNNFISRNTTGVANSGSISSCSNNKVFGNNTDTSGAAIGSLGAACTR
ncbi:MAG TPA: right-handed parallel beta-helix repeat-containing protein [Pyrinomonadaceae bacterium]|nr:right-handed parallel beta-helix repeat-containing protein [Pyrinomonadaceae bacterium]